MGSTLYLEQYLDSIENLPYELQRNFNLMRELDQRSFDLLRDIDGLSDEYLQHVTEFDGLKRTEHLKRIKVAFQKSHEFSDDKVNLAMQTYEMVDKHIRRLDADLARFEAEIKNKELEFSQPSTPAACPTPGDKKKKKEKKKKDILEDDLGRKKKKKEEEIPPPPPPPPVSTLISHSSDVLDMPVDPNEPTYCLCHQVSYGEMIGCDNSDCPIEWFHFACVGLNMKPKGKWFCPKCTTDRRRK